MMHWESRAAAQVYADETNHHYPGANARVVPDKVWDYIVFIRGRK